MNGISRSMAPAEDTLVVSGGATTKLSSKLPMTSVHPSTSTNSISLKGSEMSTGGSIIMLMLIRRLAITMSMTKNGR